LLLFSQKKLGFFGNFGCFFLVPKRGGKEERARKRGREKKEKKERNKIK
jgi:hypothetical protein